MIKLDEVEKRQQIHLLPSPHRSIFFPSLPLFPEAGQWCLKRVIENYIGRDFEQYICTKISIFRVNLSILRI